eukprot:gene6924-1237_t
MDDDTRAKDQAEAAEFAERLREGDRKRAREKKEEREKNSGPKGVIEEMKRRQALADGPMDETRVVSYRAYVPTPTDTLCSLWPGVAGACAVAWLALRTARRCALYTNPHSYVEKREAKKLEQFEQRVADEE